MNAEMQAKIKAAITGGHWEDGPNGYQNPVVDFVVFGWARGAHFNAKVELRPGPGFEIPLFDGIEEMELILKPKRNPIDELRHMLTCPCQKCLASRKRLSGTRGPE